jgi:hypothetical protein
MAITWPLPDTAQFRQSICSLSDRGHGVGAHRRLRDLHIGLDVEAHEIVAAELTPDDVSVTCSKNTDRQVFDAPARPRARSVARHSGLIR